jgi:membrane protein
VLIYWAAMTLGPLLLAASLSVTSYLISASSGLVEALPGALAFLLSLAEFALLATALSALYRYVPNTPVRRSHAWAGALFAAVGLEVARRLLAVYLGKVPTYSLVYGAFATLPILLVWIYIAWIIVLWGAVIAAYLPSLVKGTRRRATAHGWQFQLALEVLRDLRAARASPGRGISADGLAQALDVEKLQLEPVLETLVSLDWIGRVNEVDDGEETRYILLADEHATALGPLMRELLLPESDATEKLWRSGQLARVCLADVI